LTTPENKVLMPDMTETPICPFCNAPIDRPTNLTTRMPDEMPVGLCSCGAVYAFDETGHNLGAAMSEALVVSCNMDWDLAWDLVPEEDYEEAIVEHYDGITHRICPRGLFDDRRIRGALYFIKLHEDIEEATLPDVKKRLEKAKKSVPAKRPYASRKKILSKREVETFVSEYNTGPILDAAGKDRSLIRNIQRLLYSGDVLLRKRAADILGQVCAVVAEDNPSMISRLLQGLLYSITDTAAFPWGAFEAIGEIIAKKPDVFGPYLPKLYPFLSDETRRVQAMEAIARVAMSKPELLRRHTFYFMPLFDDPDPEMRAYTAWLMGSLHATEMKKDLEKLLDDDHEVRIYKDGNMELKTVGAIASEAIEAL